MKDRLRALAGTLDPVSSIAVPPVVRVTVVPFSGVGASRVTVTLTSGPPRPGFSGRPVLLETFVEVAPPRPCDAAGLLDEMSGSTSTL